MADDDLRCQFHLTESGWLKGTRKFFDHVQGQEVMRPGDALAIYELHIYQRSMWSKEERTWSLVWKKDDVSEDHLKKLAKKYPQPSEDTQW